MVGGRFVAPHALEYLAAGLRGFGGIRGQQMAEDELKQLQTTRQQAVADALRGFNENMQGTPEQVIPNLTQVDDEGNPMPQAIKPAQPQNIPAAFRALSTSPDAAMRQFAQQGAMQFAQKAAEKRQAEQDRQRYLSILESTKDPQKAIAAGVPVDLVKSYYEAPNIGRAEVARTVEITGANGEKLIQQLDKAGQPVGAPMPAYTSPMKINTGGAIELVAPKAGQRFAVGMSPSERDASARGWANVRLSQIQAENKPEKNVTVLGPNGEAITLPQSQAQGMPLYNPQSAASLQKERTKTQAKEQLSTVINQLSNSYDALEKGGGITSTQQGALSNIAARLSSSGVGQAVGGAVGTENQRQRQEIAQTRPLLMNLIKEATGMSAQQMNSNAEMMLYLQAATDPTLSIEANRSALANLDRLFGLGLAKPPKDRMPQLNQPPALQGGENSRPDQATPPSELFNAADEILNRGKK
jgi:hypothetical protein